MNATIDITQAYLLRPASHLFALAYEGALRGVTEKVEEWRKLNAGEPDVGEIAEEAAGTIMAYSKGDPAEMALAINGGTIGFDPRVDFNPEPVEQATQYVIGEGEFDGHREGVCAVGSWHEELAEERSEYGDNADRSAEFVYQLGTLVDYLVQAFGIPAGTPPRYVS